MENRIDTDLQGLIKTLPPHLQAPLSKREDLNELLEVVLDLGRKPEARLLDDTFVIDRCDVTEEDIAHVIGNISHFGEDNRAGIERTLHRISAMRNRSGKIVGLTLRVGRAV